MGVLLDSNVLISAERARQTPYALIRAVEARVGSQPLAISAIAYTELLHGLYRANTPARRDARAAFIEVVRDELPVLAYTQATAEVAGRLSAEAATSGWNVAYADLLIGATAISVGYSLLTANVRHFNLIPGLHVIPF